MPDELITDIVVPTFNGRDTNCVAYLGKIRNLEVEGQISFLTVCKRQLHQTMPCPLVEEFFSWLGRRSKFFYYSMPPG